MATCSEGQVPHVQNWGAYSGQGQTLHEACYNLGQAIDAALGNNTTTYLEGSTCQVLDAEGAFLGEASNFGSCEPADDDTGNEHPTIQCSGTCTVAIQLEAADPSSERISDLGELTMLFLCAGIVILCLRKLGDLFTVPHEKD